MWVVFAFADLLQEQKHGWSCLFKSCLVGGMPHGSMHVMLQDKTGTDF